MSLVRTVGTWAVYLDPTSQREYFVNSSTGETVWECPREVYVSFLTAIYPGSAL